MVTLPGRSFWALDAVFGYYAAVKSFSFSLTFFGETPLILASPPDYYFKADFKLLALTRW